MDRVGSLRWRLRAFWYGVLALFRAPSHPSIAPMVSRRKGPRPVRTDPPPPPEWGGPPEDEIGVGVPSRMVLATQPRLFIAVTDCVGYSNGFSFRIAVRSKDRINPESMGFPGPGREPDWDAGVQIGIRFSDGRDSRARQGPSPALMSYYREWSEGKDPPEPAGPVIAQMRGGGGDKNYDFDYFVWPLPPDGPVTITCRWPARGLQTAGKELSGTAIRAAGLKSKSVWN